MKKATRIEAEKSAAPPRSWPERLREVRLPVAVCSLAALVYSRSLFCGFVRDDIPQIVNNWQVQSWEYLPQLLSSHLWSQLGREETMLFYRPIFSVWMLLMHTFGGLAPWFWHLSSILLHAAATYLVFSLCRRLTGSEIGAVAAAAIFAVNPIHVDAVTWVSASCEVLFAICALASMLALLDSDKDKHPRVWASALWYGAALFAKETGVAILAILAVFVWLRLRGRVAKEGWVWKTAFPYAAVTAGYMLIRLAVMHRVGVETGEHTWAEVIFSSPSILLFYMKKLFIPWRLSGCYVNPLTASPTIGFGLEVAVILISLAAIVWLTFRYSSLFGIAAALIIVPVLPALGVVRIYPQGDMTHDRYLYLPSVGLSLLFAMLVKQSWSMPRPAKLAVSAVVLAVLTAFSLETAFQQRYYQNDIAFYSRVIEVTPSAAFTRGMLGNVYLDQSRFDLALEQFYKAHQTDPTNQKVTLFLARGLCVAGKYHESESVLNDLLQTPGLNPRRRKATLLSLANVQMAMGNLDYALQLFEQVDQSDDRFPELHWGMGMLYQKEGLLPQALSEYEKEFEITGDPLAQKRSATVARLIYTQSGAHSSMRNNVH